MLVGANQVERAGLRVVALCREAFSVAQYGGAGPCRRRWGGIAGTGKDQLERRRALLQALQGMQHAGIQRIGRAEHQPRELPAEMLQEPAGIRHAGHRRIDASRAWHHAAGKGAAVRCVERRGVQYRRHGEPPAVDELPRERMLLRQIQHGIAEDLADRALGRNEIGRARRVADVLVGGVLALARIGIEQAVRRAALEDEGQLPCEVLRILYAAVGAARAERRDAVRGVAGEQHIAMAEAVHAQAGKRIDADPFQGELRIRPQQRLHARHHALGRFLGDRIGVPAELEVDAPDIVGLAMQQHGLVRVERRIEPEPALGREIGFHLHVGDQEAVLEGAALAVQPEQAAQRAAGAVGRHDVAAVERIGAVRCFHRQRHGRVRRAGMALRDADDLVLPADLQVGQLARAVQQEAFGVVLLQVDEGRPLVAAFRQQVEAVDLLVAQEYLADVPAHAFFHHALAAAQPVEDIERALGEADRARAAGQRAVIVHQHHGHAKLGQVDRGGQANRPGADHDDRVSMACRMLRSLLGARLVLECQALVVDAHALVSVHSLLGVPFLPYDARRLSPGGRPTFPCRAGPSRCADA